MVNQLMNISFYIVLASLLLLTYRLLSGPSVADRAVALDAMTIISISIIAFLSLYFNRVIYLDIAIVYGLVSFLGIVAIARFLERGI